MEFDAERRGSTEIPGGYLPTLHRLRRVLQRLKFDKPVNGFIRVIHASLRGPPMRRQNSSSQAWCPMTKEQSDDNK